jgi:hypothetical protein
VRFEIARGNLTRLCNFSELKLVSDTVGDRTFTYPISLINKY